MGTSLFTARHGKRVGEDEQGNVYYLAKDGKRRWVIYNGMADASRVPPQWHRWLHRTTDDLPEEQAIAPKPWEKPHLPNLTGTQEAYRPAGSFIQAESGLLPPAIMRHGLPDQGRRMDLMKYVSGFGCYNKHA
nr:NADH:ubiquinone oxidoreductase subunit NDUFA12 [Iodidimonas gelatinilytica]